MDYLIVTIIHAKKGKNAKKRQKCKKRQNMHAQFEDSCKKRAKMKKRKHIYLDLFAFISPVHFFVF